MDYKRLGRRIKEERLKKNMTQEELSEAVDVSSAYISHIERATAKTSLETLINICNALQVSPDYLLTDSIYTSKEYIKDEIAVKLKKCSQQNLRLVEKIITAVLEQQDNDNNIT